MKSSDEKRDTKIQSHTSVLQAVISKWKKGLLSSEDFTFHLVGLSGNADKLEANNAAQAQTIKAAHIRTAEISTRYNDCQRQGKRLYKLLYAGFRVVNVGGHLSKQWLLDVKKALEGGE